MPYEQVKAILAENRAARSVPAAEPPVACPIDGEPLDVHPDGSRNCPFGNYRWP